MKRTYTRRSASISFPVSNRVSREGIQWNQREINVYAVFEMSFGVAGERDKKRAGPWMVEVKLSIFVAKRKKNFHGMPAMR